MKTSTRPSRRHPAAALPGVSGPARVDRRVAALLTRLRPGDIAVLDALDLDRATAQALVDARVCAVVDVSDAISGRFPNLGPQVLVRAGIVLVDGTGPDVLTAVKDGTALRVHDGQVFADERQVATGRPLDQEGVAAQMEAARRGMVSQLQTFTHHTSEFLRREQDLLLHGLGLPTLSVSMAGRPAVVVADPHALAARRKALRAFLREQRPVLLAVDAGADALLAAGLKPDVVVVSAGVEPPSAKAVAGARDVLLVVEPGATRATTERLERLGARPLRWETTANPTDAALLLADAAGASVIVEVGGGATLEEFLDRNRTDLASTYLTRLKVGSRIVDAAAVPTLYSGKVRVRHLLLALLVCVLVVAAAVATTPVGQEWAQDAWTWLGDLAAELRARLP